MIEFDDGPAVAANAKSLWSRDIEVQFDMHELANQLVYSRCTSRDAEAVAILAGRLQRFEGIGAGDAQLAISSTLRPIANETLLAVFSQPQLMPALKAGRRRWAQALGLAGCFELENPLLAFDQASAIGMRWLAMFHPDFSTIKPDNSCSLIIPARRDISSVFFGSLMNFGKDLNIEHPFERAMAVGQSVRADARFCQNTKIGGDASMQEFSAWLEKEWIGHETRLIAKNGLKGPRL